MGSLPEVSTLKACLHLHHVQTTWGWGQGLAIPVNHLIHLSRQLNGVKTKLVRYQECNIFLLKFILEDSFMGDMDQQKNVVLNKIKPVFSLEAKMTKQKPSYFGNTM